MVSGRIRDVSMVPGTELMTDVDGSPHVHVGNLANSVVLVPQPSENLHDPLNWSTFWKMTTLVNLGAFIMFSHITTLAIAPMTPILEKQFNKPLSDIALLTGLVVISLGYANFVIVPCADIFGRRRTLLVCVAIVFGASIWSGFAKSFGSLLAARVIVGFGAAANESIMQLVVADMCFLHERARYVGLSFACFSFGAYLGPIISGAIATHLSWRWFFWICSIVQGFVFISLAISFPETGRLYCHLDLPAFDEVVPPAKESPTAVGTKTMSDGTEEDIQSPISGTHHLVPEGGILIDPVLGRGRPSRAQFSLLNRPYYSGAPHTVVLHVFLPLRVFFFPIILWAGMTHGFSNNAILAINIFQSQALGAPPYKFTPSQVGYANFALAAGAFAGLLLAGPVSDWLATYRTKKNGGVREPEMRLLALAPVLALAVIGHTFVGEGFDHAWSWEVPVIVGFPLSALVAVATSTICITYAIDCYKPLAGQIMVTATICKNTFGFGMSYFYNDWIVGSGFMTPMAMLLGTTVGLMLMGILVGELGMGKCLRRLTAGSGIHTLR